MGIHAIYLLLMFSETVWSFLEACFLSCKDGRPQPSQNERSQLKTIPKLLLGEVLIFVCFLFQMILSQLERTEMMCKLNMVLTTWTQLKGSAALFLTSRVGASSPKNGAYVHVMFFGHLWTR